MEHLKNVVTQEEKIGRRDLLKAIAATSGAVVAASVLPSSWTKPIIEAGVLPAHAQGSIATATPTTATATPTAAATITFTNQNSSQYEITVTQPDGTTFTLNGAETRTAQNGSYTVSARYIGPTPIPSPDPRPKVEISTSSGKSASIAPATFDNTAASSSALVAGTFTYP
jgi:hypothetical protein